MPLSQQPTSTLCTRRQIERASRSQVRQVREDSEGNVLEEILLGQAGSEGVPHGIIEPAKGSSRHDSGSILSFEMSGGSVCEATGRPRTVKAQWSCGRGVTALKGVREEGMCEYEVDLTSELLCDDPR